MTYDEAATLYLENRDLGRHKGKRGAFPYKRMRYHNDSFIEIEVSLEAIRDSGCLKEIRDRYVALLEDPTVELGPVWVSAGKRLEDGSVSLEWDLLLEIMDGHQRMAAYKKIGRKTIKAVMPQSHYDAWRNRD